MKQEVASSVAWFKLAELVSRGEKEKALTLFRLLSHSFDGRAYTLQIEGDILWAFEDEEAIGRYQQAALLYREEGKISSSAAIYEHLIFIYPDNYDFRKLLTLCYACLGWGKKLNKSFTVFCALAEKKGLSQGDMQSLVDEIGEVFHERPEEEGFRPSF